MATPTKIGSPKAVSWGGTQGTLASEEYMDGAAPSESPLADSLPARSHTSPLSQALASERAERSEEGKKALLQRWEHGHPEEGPWSQQEEERKTERGQSSLSSPAWGMGPLG